VGILDVSVNGILKTTLLFLQPRSTSDERAHIRTLECFANQARRSLARARLPGRQCHDFPSTTMSYYDLQYYLVFQRRALRLRGDDITYV
jgi:hypothetical protein